MKKFISKIVLIFIIAFSLLIAMNYIFIKNVKGDTLAAFDNLEFDQIPETIKYVTMGSSHGQRSIKYSVMGNAVYNSAFNFGMSSQSLVYDYNWVKEYKDHFVDEGGVAFLPVSYFSLYKNELLESDFEKKNYRYYPYLSKENMREWDLVDSLLYGKIYPEFPILQYADKQIGTIFYLDNDWLPDEVKNKRSTFDKKKEPKIINENMQSLENLIKFFKSKNYKVVLLTTPLKEEAKKDYSDLFLQKYYNDMKEIADKYKVDYYNCENWLKGEQYFIDPQHLSEEGAEKFTQILFEIVQ